VSAVESSTASDVKVHIKCIPPGWQEIDACGLSTKELSDRLRSMTIDGATGFVLTNICGQRYIGTRLYLPSIDRKVEIEVHGTPGNDLGAFMSGHKITVHGNVQDGVGNTMDDGEITVEGRGGDVLGMSMRGGKIFVRDSVGYRTALHMKEYLDKKPVLVIGGTAQDFLGEYMAGGIVVLLGIGCIGHDAQFIGTGMHGGVIFLRGTVDRSQLGKEVEISTPTKDDLEFLDKMVAEFLGRFPMLSLSKDDIMKDEFVKLSPISKRPYGKLYAY
jgi:glutamate synthase domain-containing protein 3